MIPKRKILIVDDDTITINILRTVLEENNYQIFTVNDGKQVFDFALKNNPDLIFLDISKPEITGFQVLDELKREKSLCEVPVIITSEHSNIKVKTKSFKSGAVDFISKPIIAEELLYT